MGTARSRNAPESSGLTRIGWIGYLQTVPEDVGDAERDALRLYVDALITRHSYAVAEPWLTLVLDDLIKHFAQVELLVRDLSYSSALLVFTEALRAAAPKTIKLAPAKLSVTRRPPVHLVVLVLIWLILVGGPLAEGKLPSEIQTMLSTEVGTIALALAITQWMNDKRK